MKKLRALGISLAMLGGSSAAMAQADTRAAVAEGLYRQARDLMAAGRFDEACPKFAESQRLDPATGTLLNLAACHERQGKLATAWIEYSDVMAAARRDQREDRVEYARQRTIELEPKLSRLTLQLAAGADHPGLTLELDNATLGRAVIGVPMPIDPGTHTVRAKAPGKLPWTQTIEIGALADQKSLDIPPLQDAPLQDAPLQDEAPTHTLLSTAPRPQVDEPHERPVPTSVYLAGGVTLALGVGAGVTGFAYLNKREAYDAAQTQDNASELRRTARNYGYVNLALWAATAAGAGVTTYLYVTRPGRASSARVLPWATADSAGLAVAGGF